MALDMAQFFAVWKLPILQLDNCKKKKSVKRRSHFLFIPKTGRTE